MSTYVLHKYTVTESADFGFIPLLIWNPSKEDFWNPKKDAQIQAKKDAKIQAKKDFEIQTEKVDH